MWQRFIRCAAAGLQRQCDPGDFKSSQFIPDAKHVKLPLSESNGRELLWFVSRDRRIELFKPEPRKTCVSAVIRSATSVELATLPFEETHLRFPNCDSEIKNVLMQLLAFIATNADEACCGGQPSAGRRPCGFEGRFPASNHSELIRSHEHDALSPMQKRLCQRV